MSMLEAVESRVMFSQTWFVAPTGSDSNPGTLNAPLQTIQAAANAAQPGDTVMIRGGTYRESVTPPRSGTASAPITYEAYNNEPVIISGADAVSGWTQYGGSIYDAPQSWTLGAGNDQVFVDGQMINEARFPNTSLDVSHPTRAVVSSATTTATDNGWLFPATATISDPSLTAPAGTWVGATIHIAQGQQWVVQTGTVLSSAVGSLTFSFEHLTSYELPVPGSIYYLTGTFKALDAAGEWYRDPTTGLLYVWTPAGDSPAAHDIEVKHRSYAFDLSGRSYVTLEGISLFAATINTDSNSTQLILSSINAQYISQNTLNPVPWDANNTDTNSGIQLNGTHNILQNSTIAFSSGDGVHVSGSDNIVQNCVIHDVDYSGGDSAAIEVIGTRQQILGNTIYNAGRSGITITFSTAGTIEHNTIHDVGLQTTDLGGVYTWGSDGQGTQIAYNTIYDVTAGGFGAAGVLLDNGSFNYSIHDNTIYDVDHPLKRNPPANNDTFVNNDIKGGSNEFFAESTPASGTGNGVTDLGTFGGFTSQADAINNTGQIVGASSTGTDGSKAFLSLAGNTSNLGGLGGADSEGAAINKAGTVAGSAYPANGPRHAFMDVAGTMTDLGTLPGDIASAAFGINSAGMIVGLSYDEASEDHAFIWVNGAMQAIPTLGGILNAALGVNDSGWVVGASTLAGDLNSHAFVYRNGSLTDLGTLGGSSSYALAVNNQDEIVGESRIAGDGALHAFAYQNGTMTDLGSLPGLPNTVATAINNNGDIVGYAYNLATFTQHAFLYHNGVMIDLNQAVPNNGWTFTTASGINDSGQIVGAGTNPSGYSNAFTVNGPQRGGPVSTTGPAAVIAAPNITTSGTQTITVTYTDANANVLWSSIGTGNLSLTGAGNSHVLVTAVRTSPNYDAPTVVATYTIAPAGGQWTAAANGNYDVSLVPGQVADTLGNSATATPTTLNVAVPFTTPLRAAIAGKLPMTAIAGQRHAPIIQTVTVTNSGATTVTGPIVVSLLLSSAGAGAAGEVVATSTRRLTLRPGQHVPFALVFHSIPADLTGTLSVAAQVTDPQGNIVTTFCASTISSQAPVIQLVGAFASIPAVVLAGHNLPVNLFITNAGNVPAVGSLAVDLLLSANAALDAGSIDLGTVIRHIAVLPERKPILQLLKSIPKGLSGTYTLFARFSDPNSTFSDPTLVNQTITATLIIR